ncbi:MAG: CHAT domain-containing tetratricopeptide repeat protein [Leptolyngbyaceae bacterium]|nr:CHAT domain-containing tetratricopeptide repeat protein [Leptolyngbyaceae bacterium]
MRSPTSPIVTAGFTVWSIWLGSAALGGLAAPAPAMIVAQGDAATPHSAPPSDPPSDPPRDLPSDPPSDPVDQPLLDEFQGDETHEESGLGDDDRPEDGSEGGFEDASERELAAEAQRLLQQGHGELEQDNLEGAIAAWQQAFDLYQQLGDLLGEAQTLGNLGYVANLIGSYDQAIALYQTALTIARELDSDELQLNFLGSLGLIYSTLNQVEQAIAAYEQALPLAQMLGNRVGEGAIAGGLAFAYEQTGAYGLAQELYQLMLMVATEQGDAATVTIAQSSLDRVAGAIAAAATEPADSSTPAPSPSDSVGIDFGNTATATDLVTQLQQQLQSAREIDDGVTEAITLLQLAGVYRDRHQLGLAITTFEQTLERSSELDIPALTEQALLNLASLYQVVGQYGRSQQAAQSLLELATQLGDTIGQITAWQNLGGVYFATGDMTGAIAAYEEGLTLLQTIDDPFNEAVALALLAEAHLGQQSPNIALEWLTQGLAIAQNLEDTELEGAIWGSVGKAHALAGDYTAAIDALQRNLDYEKRVGNGLGMAIAHNNLGTAYFLADSAANGDAVATDYLALATEQLQAAIALWEQQQATVVTSDPFQVSIFETQQQAYQTLQQVLVAQGQTEEALIIAEQGRAQALATLLTRNATPSPMPQLPENFIIEQIQQAAREQNATLVVYSITYTPAALFIPGRVDQTPTADLFIWVVDPTGEIQFRQTPIPRSLSAMVSDFRQTLGIASGRNLQLEPLAPGLVSESNNAISLELSSLLIDPIQDLLPTAEGDRLIILPQRELFLVPFAALQDRQGTYLIETYTLVTAPSIQVLIQVEAVAAGMAAAPLAADEVLIVGNPDPMPTLMRPHAPTPTPLQPLPGSAQEAEAIASQIFQTDALIGTAATEAAVTERLATARLIHFATHGLLEYGDPQASGVRDVPGAIALAPTAAVSLGEGNTDGFLTATELQTMDLQATLAVLSACDTGQGDLRGDGVVGLARSLFAAGVPSVMVSLWAVDDAATADLMTAFYRAWRSPEAHVPIDKATALRQAMLTTMAQYPEPRFWAAFILIGAD